ncbi:hypothetical protein HID58_020514, partial [Brassica napus]
MCSSLLMANSRAFSDLKSGQCSSVVEARLLRFWEARNVKCGGEIKWMDLLMVDVKATMMQVTISSSRTLLPVDTYLLYCWTSVCKEYGLFI